MRPGTFHTPGLPTELMRIINSSERALRGKPKERVQRENKPRAPKRQGGRARKEQE